MGRGEGGTYNQVLRGLGGNLWWVGSSQNGRVGEDTTIHRKEIEPCEKGQISWHDFATQTLALIIRKNGRYHTYRWTRSRSMASHDHRDCVYGSDRFIHLCADSIVERIVPFASESAFSRLWQTEFWKLAKVEGAVDSNVGNGRAWVFAGHLALRDSVLLCCIAKSEEYNRTRDVSRFFLEPQGSLDHCLKGVIAMIIESLCEC